MTNQSLDSEVGTPLVDEFLSVSVLGLNLNARIRWTQLRRSGSEINSRSRILLYRGSIVNYIADLSRIDVPRDIVSSK